MPIRFWIRIKHQYELVFLDIRMPGLNGMMAAHELREMDHTVVLVFLTSLGAVCGGKLRGRGDGLYPEALPPLRWT